MSSSPPAREGHGGGHFFWMRRHEHPSDRGTRFGLTAGLNYYARPFASAADMDEARFANWRACTGPENTVYHLGDVLFGNRDQAKTLGERIRKLPGSKPLVPGNHDHRHMALLATVFDEVRPPLADVKMPIPQGSEDSWNGWRAICHYPPPVWNGCCRGRPALLRARPRAHAGHGQAHRHRRGQLGLCACAPRVRTGPDADGRALRLARDRAGTGGRGRRVDLARRR